MTTITTNIDSVTAAIRIIGDRAYLELAGDIERMDAVDVDAVAQANGYRVVDVVDETTLALASIDAEEV